MNLMIDPPHLWSAIYNARSNMSHPATSPNTAPATQKECHQWSASHMKRHFQWASKITLHTHQVLRLPRNSEFKISVKNPWIASAKIKTIRPWSEHEIVISHPPLRRPDSSHLGDAFCMKKQNISRSGYLPKLHEMLRLPRKVTLRLHHLLRLPRKMHSTELFSTPFSRHLFSLGIYSLLASSL